MPRQVLTTPSSNMWWGNTALVAITIMVKGFRISAARYWQQFILAQLAVRLIEFELTDTTRSTIDLGIVFGMCVTRGALNCACVSRPELLVGLVNYDPQIQHHSLVRTAMGDLTDRAKDTLINLPEKIDEHQPAFKNALFQGTVEVLANCKVMEADGF